MKRLEKIRERKTIKIEKKVKKQRHEKKYICRAVRQRGNI